MGQKSKSEEGSRVEVRNLIVREGGRDEVEVDDGRDDVFGEAAVRIHDPKSRALLRLCPKPTQAAGFK